MSFPTDTQSALEVNSKSYRTKYKVKILSASLPFLENSSKGYSFENKTGQKIPKENDTLRLFKDGVELLIFSDENGTSRAFLFYTIKRNMTMHIDYNWNITDAGIYVSEFDKDTMEVEWL